nr:MAG TPA: hypothetical protein [Bacteriophage sp.]
MSFYLFNHNNFNLVFNDRKSLRIINHIYNVKGEM